MPVGINAFGKYRITRWFTSLSYVQVRREGAKVMSFGHLLLWIWNSNKKTAIIKLVLISFALYQQEGIADIIYEPTKW